MSDHGPRLHIVEILAVLLGMQQRVDHGEHGTSAQSAEPCFDELHAIRQHDQHAIFGLHTDTTQRRSSLTRACDHLLVGPRLLAHIEAALRAPPFAQIAI